jgi:hypothetical protein
LYCNRLLNPSKTDNSKILQNQTHARTNRLTDPVLSIRSLPSMKHFLRKLGKKNGPRLSRSWQVLSSARAFLIHNKLVKRILIVGGALARAFLYTLFGSRFTLIINNKGFVFLGTWGRCFPYGASVVSGSYVLPSHSWIAHLLTLSLSLRISSLFCRVTQCM